jgi:hypothetical protein
VTKELVRQYENRDGSYTSAGRWDALRHEPPLTSTEHPERIKRLESSTNEVIEEEARRFVKDEARLEERERRAAQKARAANEDHAKAKVLLKKAATARERSEQAYEKQHHTAPVYRGFRRYIGPAVVTVLATCADAPLNYEAFSRGGENDYRTWIFTAIVTVIVMMGCHFTGKLLREATSAVSMRIAVSIGAMIFGILLAVSLIRRSVIAANVAQYFPDVEPAVFFLLYLCLQLLVFVIAILLAYRIHCPWLADYEQKWRAEARSNRFETRMCDRVHDAEERRDEATASITKEKHLYHSRDIQCRIRAYRKQSLYNEANEKHRTDLSDGRKPVAYSLPLRLIVPPTLMRIRVELGYRDHDSEKPRLNS